MKPARRLARMIVLAAAAVAAGAAGVAGTGPAAPVEPVESAEVPAGIPAGEPAAAHVPAVWVEHDASFAYIGYTTYYSCYGLRDKVRRIMRRVGARPDDLEVRVSCVESSGVEVMPRVRIHAALPAAATPELLQKLAEDATGRLVAKVRGDGDTRLTQFPAAAQVVEFDGSHRDVVEDGDCELLEQMVDKVFTPMGVAKLEGSRLSCGYRSVPAGSIKLRLATLQKAPEPDAAPKSH